MATAFCQAVTIALKAGANPARAAQQVAYFKNVLPFIGISSAGVNDTFASVTSKHSIEGAALLQCFEYLLQQDHFEAKLCAILCVHSAPKRSMLWASPGPGSDAVISAVERCIDGKYVFDWATADGVAGRIRFKCRKPACARPTGVQ